MTTFTSNEQNQIPIHTDPERCLRVELWHALPGRRCSPHTPSPKGFSRMRRTATQTTHTLADIDALIDSAARARLRLALQDAVQCPSPENVAALQEWPREWVLEEEAVYSTVRDQRNRSPNRRNCRCEPAPADGARVRANHGGDGSGGRPWIADGRNIAPLRESLELMAKDLSTVFYALEGAGRNGWKRAARLRPSADYSWIAVTKCRFPSCT
jgi:hypothetical protein